MADARISVVVPFYNNVDQLGDCLASIAAQTFTDLQVVTVDDGSTDGSAEVAKAWAAADPRFAVLRLPNGGPGSARNHGVAVANGEFLAFVDSDDLLPPDAYATLLGVLESSGSDFACGGVLRLTADGLVSSGLHDQAIKARRIGTHISRTPELCYDISVWNKLFRRSFWESAGLAFPEGMLWEDLVAMTKAHVLARAVDVITDSIYHWRDRDKGAPSITQSRTDISNFRDRITALEMIDAFLRDRATPALLRAHQHKALVNDLWLYIRDLSKTSAGYQDEFVTLAARYLRQVEPRVVASLPATRKLACYLIEQERQAELTEYAAWLAANPGRTPPVVRRFGRLRADLPASEQGGHAIPARVLRPQWRELDPQVAVDKISWRGRSLVIEGSAYVPSVDIASRRNTTKLLVLVPRSRTRPPLVVPARSVRRPDVTAASEQERYSYEWSGFRCEISPRLFGVGGRWLTGEWDCYVLVRGRSVWRPARLHTPGPQAARPSPLRVAPGISFGARWAGRRLRVRVARESPGAPVVASVPGAGPPASLSQAWNDDGQLLLCCALPSDVTCQVVVRQLDGWERHVLEVEPGIQAATVGVPVAAMDVFGDQAPLRDGRWQIELRDSSAGGAVLPYSLTAVDGREVKNGKKIYRCSAGGRDDGDRLELAVGPALAAYERGRVRRRLLRDLYYPAQRRLPVRAAVLFVSFDGKSCSDNPLGIAEELRRRGDRREQIWAVSDWSVRVPEGSKGVLTGSAGYFAALGRCGHVIANDHLPQPHRVRRGQRYVQTWHGTPLKRLGYDIAKPSFASGSRYFDFMAGDVAQWDLLISPNPFSTPIMRQAFRYDGEIGETGYPRNDALLSMTGTHAGAGAGTDGRAEVVANIRRRLSIGPDKRVAMYVPTWRDDQHSGRAGYRLDFQLDLADAARQLSGDFVLLVRGHHLMDGWVQSAGQPGFAIDVTRYPDINDLLAATDVLITDYSSVMFDFAPTGRPMILFTYDLEQYRDQLRGFYFDFEAVAPGPLLATSAEVVAAVADIDAVAERSRAAREAFAARFCPLDDGKAAARACDRIF